MERETRQVPQADNFGIVEAVRRRAGAAVIDNGLRSISRLGKMLPVARRLRRDVEVIQNLRYRRTGQRSHLLDVYRPRDYDPARDGALPVVLYVHGGGFRILSKDTHWLMGLQFARRGCVVFNINYRLSGEAPFPAAIEDACHAFTWVHRHAADFGGDTSRLLLAGESAGANLVTSLAISTSYRRPEPWAHAVFETGVVPSAVVAACGMFQVSDPERFMRRRPLPRWLADRIEEVCHAYLRGPVYDGPGGLDLADPLLVLERGEEPHRPLPPFYAPVGTKDPLLDDTRRLRTALEAMDVPAKVTIHPGEVHAFHALIWRPEARKVWRHTFDFLDAHVFDEESGPDSAGPSAEPRVVEARATGT